MEYQDPNPWDPEPQPPPPAAAPPPAAGKRYNTTANWQDPYNPPSPGDPYWDDWIAANPDYRGQGYTGPTAAPPPPPPPPPPPTPNPDAGKLIQPFNQPYVPTGSGGPNPMPMPTIGGSVGTIPGAPDFPNIPSFQQPTLEEAMNDPGYQFTLQQGQKSLENWSASRGTLNDSSTAKALIDYGQGAATTNYGNVWNRDYQAYNTNTENQYIAPYAAQYQNWLTGTVNPTMAQYATNAANVSHLNDTRWQDNWNSYLQSWNQFRDQRDSTFNHQLAIATA